MRSDVVPLLHDSPAPAPAEPQVLAALVQTMLFCALSEGLPLAPLLERSGLALTEVDLLLSTVPYRKVLALVRAIHELSGPVNLGLMMGRRFSTDRLGPLGAVLQRAPTFGRALKDFLRFQRVLNGGVVRWDLQAGLNACVVQITPCVELTDISWILEAPITMIVALARELCGQPVTPLAVSFRHAPRGDTAAYDHYFGTTSQFHAASDRLVLDPAVLALPLRAADPSIYPLLWRALDADQGAPVVESSGAGPAIAQALSEEVRAHIARALPEGAPRKNTVAKALGMSARTLLCRLNEAGTSFDALLDGTRRGLALEAERGRPGGRQGAGAGAPEEARPPLVIDWRKSQRTRAAVQVAINDALEELPEAFEPAANEQLCQALFDHVYESYYGEEQSKYHQGGATAPS